jgi:colanic acid biosynthesis protein WcaH
VTQNTSRLNDADFAQLIRTAPLVAIDVVLRDPQGRVFLACRRDEPARGYYFVPGGRIFKNEQIAAAFRRILKDETGFELEIADARLLGVFQHFYPNNRFETEGINTHYVILAYEIETASSQVRASDPGKFRWADASAIGRMDDVHPFTQAYFEPAFSGLTAAAAG